MKRRTFLGMMAAAVAVGMAPAFLNATRLQVAESVRKTFTFGFGPLRRISEVGVGDPIAGRLIMRHILPEPITVLSEETIEFICEIPITDDGKDLMAWTIHT